MIHYNHKGVNELLDIKEVIKHYNIKDEDRILNGGDFFNGIQGFTSTDLLNTYSSF